MDELKNCELNAEELADVAGGQTQDANGAHWQPVTVPMGTAFQYRGHVWYRFKLGDTLGAVAAKFGVSPEYIQGMNPLTIRNINKIDAGDAVVVRKNPAGYTHLKHYPQDF